MKIRIKSDGINGTILFWMLCVICIAAKIFQITYLPDKYFYDGKRILMEALSGVRQNDKGYDFAEDAFAMLIRIFRISDQMQWAVFLGVVGNVIILLFVKKYLKNLFLVDFIFLVSSLVLINIYIFTVGKEMIQMLFLLPVIYVLRKDYSETVRIVITTVMLLGITVFLKTYYVLVLGLFLAGMYLLKNASRYNKKRIGWTVAGGIVAGLIGLYFLQEVYPDLYQRAITVRYSINQYRIGSTDADTIIMDVISNASNPLIYFCNLVINFFRICFPIELYSKGVAQIIFMLYQIIFSGKLFFKLRQCLVSEKTGGKEEIALLIILSLLIVSAVFEPDFGSVARHEINFFPIACICFMEGRVYEV